VLLMCAIAYRILEIYLIKYHDENYPLKLVTKRGLKENISMLIYIASIPLAYINTWLAIAGFIMVAIIWVIPTKNWKVWPRKSKYTFAHINNLSNAIHLLASWKVVYRV